ncbi:MAG: nicotinate-nucleotide--dimethylbenzimidazole phosphoribosyltransferase [Gammaproteobacteria bacterium]|nr:nicotinate-nucleotide--dimethylbenzimidazole phosphoribosyltransferase [Gammaproteobacteria bacterium]MDH5651130.1 nicotinate-nucleotide--dimethylbenzimidazole phosphoribosyltransferase [Gammaproteobacteria bacterium]
MNTEWLTDRITLPDNNVKQAAQARQLQLTKPPGSLGKLEEIAVRLAAMQGTQDIALDKVHMVVFAGDHGIAAAGVSAFPQAVTTEMVKNFARGGAAISVMAAQLNAALEVVDVGSVTPAGDLPGVVDARVAAGTANFAEQAAMDHTQLASALNTGRVAVERAIEKGMQLFIGGDMGIANTSAATAIACALLNKPAVELTGPGTGLDSDGVTHKAQVIQSALDKHQAAMHNKPLEVLRHVGGFEIAALCGAYLACAQRGIPFVVDGFIATSAALVAVRLQTDVKAWLFMAHRSAEPGHRAMVEAIGMEPLLDMGMRLGEGSGAALAVPILQMAAATHSKMATFAEAGVSEQA